MILSVIYFTAPPEEVVTDGNTELSSFMSKRLLRDTSEFARLYADFRRRRVQRIRESRESIRVPAAAATTTATAAGNPT